jgi:hypothetical protein
LKFTGEEIRKLFVRFRTLVQSQNESFQIFPDFSLKNPLPKHFEILNSPTICLVLAGHPDKSNGYRIKFRR